MTVYELIKTLAEFDANAEVEILLPQENRVSISKVKPYYRYTGKDLIVINADVTPEEINEFYEEYREDCD